MLRSKTVVGTTIVLNYVVNRERLGMTGPFHGVTTPAFGRELPGLPGHRLSHYSTGSVGD
jgi:hypothetical protein